MKKKDEEMRREQVRVMEEPFSGLHYINEVQGTYRCRVCKADLFSSEAKFHSGSGWPTFDDSYKGSTELRFIDKLPGKAVHCADCGEFLGTYITGEDFTSKNQRYNINSRSLDFIPGITPKRNEQKN